METKKPFLRKITPYDKDGQPGKLLLVFGNDTTIEIEKDKISEPNQTRAFWHGLSQRLGDSVAGCSKDLAYDYAAKTINELYLILQSTEWNKRHEGGKGETEQSILDLIDAIAKMKKKDSSLIEPTVRNATREKRDEWRKHPEIVVALGEIALKRMKQAAKESESLDFPD